MALSYKEQLQHPLWQKKRLEIFERDNFTCLICGQTEKQLQVHHVTYLKDYLAWEYPNSLLLTLCCDCHEDETNNFIFIIFSVKLVIDLMKLTKQNFNQLSDIDNTIALLQMHSDYEYLEALKIEYLKLLKHS